MAEDTEELVPPNGGWGWVICFAFALNNVIVMPLMLCFGLIFQDIFPELNISATQTLFLLSSNQAIALLFSLYNLKLLKRYKYRKMAAFGSILLSIGVLIISGGTTVLYFFVAYSLMTSIGLSITMSSFALALNCYFTTKRNMALNIGLFITGLGPIFMPHFMSFLMIKYGIPDAIKILAALSLNSLAAALMLRPVKWYMRPKLKESTKTANHINKIPMKKNSILKIDTNLSSECVSENENDYLEQMLESDVESCKIKSNSANNMTNSEEHINLRYNKWWKSMSLDLNLTSSLDSFKQQNEREKSSANKTNSFNSAPISNDSNSITINNNINTKTKDKGSFKSIKQHMTEIFQDYKMINIVIELSLALTVDTIFTLLIPFVLCDLNMNVTEIANVLSVLFAADFLFRIISPLIGKWCYASSTIMYYMSLYLTILTRTTFILASSYPAMLIVAIGLGISRGLSSENVHYIIPSYVSSAITIHRANNVKIFITAPLLIILGPILGYIRDFYGSYKIAIIVINVITMIVIILWSLEYIYQKIRRKCSK